MCLALIAVKQHPEYPIIILSNRDEFYIRPTEPAHYWQDSPRLFAGQDLVGGGSWLGINKNGQFALVTNYRNPKAYDTSLLSRGVLVKEYLQKNIDPYAYIKTISPSAHQYNLYSLIVGNLNEIFYYSNVEEKTIKLKPGLYGLSNHLLDTPWYKVSRIKKLFKQALSRQVAANTPDQIEAHLFPILEDQTPAPDNLLPKTGVTQDLEKALSSIFVNIPQHDYGTRNSTLLLFSKNKVYFSEKVFKNAKMIFNQRQNIILTT
ncbi:NRDE family protein [Legionella fallonii]|uniref:NRDE family protein n=1 Tax=Legionella fallonii LLAP-10 TaxID=1212491 RepID=A0A098G4S0_9GAMM|nr:NRDE family protein [Legionella fallonii]CEG57462.1 conserved protein of unknown function [Legionella fallonii LLAP-10]